MLASIEAVEWVVLGSFVVPVVILILCSESSRVKDWFRK